MAKDPATTVTQILEAADDRSRRPAAELLPLVYDELRKLAQARMASERGPQTLQPTALVHEAYLRLVKSESLGWSGKGHFFGAAGRAMQRILVERARQRKSLKRGGNQRRVTFDQELVFRDEDADEILMLHDALERLSAIDPRKADIVRLRYFAGLSVEDTGSALGISKSTVKEDWAFSRAWLLTEMGNRDASD